MHTTHASSNKQCFNALMVSFCASGGTIKSSGHGHSGSTLYEPACEMCTSSECEVRMKCFYAYMIQHLIANCELQSYFFFLGLENPFYHMEMQ